MKSYQDFLVRCLDQNRIRFVLQRDLASTDPGDQIVMSIRHDVDANLQASMQMAQIESILGIQTTYFILHTARYYGTTSVGHTTHNQPIIAQLIQLQEDWGHEVGWHNDLVTLQIVYDIDPVAYLHNELDWLRTSGIDIVGTASHGSIYCDVYQYLNFYFFSECAVLYNPEYPNIDYVIKKGKRIDIAKGVLSDFGLSYEAYLLPRTKYFADSNDPKTDLKWHVDMLDMDNSLVPGDKVILLIHPQHWTN